MSLKWWPAARLVLSVVTHHSARMTGIYQHPSLQERSPAASSVSEKKRIQPRNVNISDDACWGTQIDKNESDFSDWLDCHELTPCLRSIVVYTGHTLNEWYRYINGINYFFFWWQLHSATSNLIQIWAWYINLFRTENINMEQFVKQIFYNKIHLPKINRLNWIQNTQLNKNAILYIYTNRYMYAIIKICWATGIFMHNHH